MDLGTEVSEVICKTLSLKKEEMVESKRLYDTAGVDSTEMVELIVALSNHFGIKLETNEITKFSTPQEIAGIIKNKKRS